MKSLLIALLISIPSTVVFAESNCTGMDSQTGAYVYGQCDDKGVLTAMDSMTGAPVVGDCSVGNDNDDVDSFTGSLVIVSCQ